MDLCRLIFHLPAQLMNPTVMTYQTGINEQPVPETVNDFELGLNKKTPDYNWGITGYYMLYQNQLVLTGKINDVGEYTRTNTPRSWRLGLELQGGDQTGQLVSGFRKSDHQRK